MTIGDDENYLIIEPRDPGDGDCAVLRIRIGAAAEGEFFTAQHDSIVSDTSPAKRAEFREFEELRQNQLEIRLSHKGWLRLTRDGRGHIAVRCRLIGRRAVAAMEGEQIIEAEFAEEFCREFGKVFRP